MIPEKIRTRIAPTPSGYLHMGNLFSFVLTWLIAKKENGTVRLRIDDLDADRMRREFLEDIFETLDWIGLQPDEGPSGLEDFLKNYAQQKRLPLYQSLIEKLVNTGKVYACTCSRKQILAINPEGIYPGTCLKKNMTIDHENAALRIHIKEEESWISIPGFEPNSPTIKVNLQKDMGDFVIRKKDGLPAYQITSLADDLRDGINVIVRGEDLLTSTAAQIFMAKTLGENPFSAVRFLHHPLIKNENSGKLSKSAGHTSLQYMRKEGFTSINALAILAKWMGLPSNNYQSLAELQATCSALPIIYGNILADN